MHQDRGNRTHQLNVGRRDLQRIGRNRGGEPSREAHHGPKKPRVEEHHQDGTIAGDCDCAVVLNGV